MKIIFLDFDGVILTLRTCVAHDKRGWSNAAPDPVLVNVIKRCCNQGVRIVVSSTWRTHEASCHAKLEEAGLLNFLHADWRTIEFYSPEAALSRAVEIKEWLARHPEVEDFRILDDDTWMWTDKQKERFLKCDAEDGASARVMMALLEWAGAKDKPSKEPLLVIRPDEGETARYGKVRG